MTAPPAVDLGLPTDPQLSAAATPDPRAAAARLASAADPARIAALSRGFTESGTGLDGLYRSSGEAQRRLADGFRNDGAPVYDEATHAAALPAGFRDAGSHLQTLGRRLGAVADELRAAMTDVTAELQHLQAGLDGQRRRWASELAALGGGDRRFPAEAIAGLLARRNAIAGQMQESTNSCGRAVSGRIERYNESLHGCLQLLDEFRYLRIGPFPGAAPAAADTSGTRLNRTLQPGGIGADQPRPELAPLTVPGPGGASVEVLPPAEGARLEGVHGIPPAPGGPSINININVPAPVPETQIDRGPISPSGQPGSYFDTQDRDAGPQDNQGPSVDETLAGLRPGQTPPNLEVDTPDELRGIWDELTSTGTPVASTYPGEFERLPDGTSIGYRAASKSGGATIDVFKADGTHVKVHLS